MTEYEICQKRGHNSTVSVTIGNNTQYTCDWCGTVYGYEPARLIEYKINNPIQNGVLDNNQPNS